MLSDLTLLKLFFNNTFLYAKYKDVVNKDALTRQGQIIFEDIGTYYELYKDAIIDPARFAEWFLHVQHSNLTDVKSQLYLSLFEQLDKTLIDTDNDDKYLQNVLASLEEEHIKQTIRDKLDQEKVNWEEITQLSTDISFSATDINKWEHAYVSNEYTEIMRKTDRTGGLHWRLQSLEKSIGPIIKGDFIVVAAEVETGKTSFLASEISYMAEQLTEGTIVWFCNEQECGRVQDRIWTSALKIPKEELDKSPIETQEAYIKAMHGDLNRIKLFDATRMTVRDMRACCLHFNPKLIIIDMLDKIPLDSKKATETLQLLNLYIQIRALAKDFCPVIGTSQCDGTSSWRDKNTGEIVYQRYITMKQLRESKVNKQGEAEAIITIGKDEEYPMTRYIHVAKNKLPGTGDSVNRYIKSECKFYGELSLFID